MKGRLAGGWMRIGDAGDDGVAGRQMRDVEHVFAPHHPRPHDPVPYLPHFFFPEVHTHSQLAE